jgi:hypothetical protein
MKRRQYGDPRSEFVSVVTDYKYAFFEKRLVGASGESGIEGGDV